MQKSCIFWSCNKTFNMVYSRCENLAFFGGVTKTFNMGDTKCKNLAFFGVVPNSQFLKHAGNCGVVLNPMRDHSVRPPLKFRGWTTLHDLKL